MLAGDKPIERRPPMAVTKKVLVVANRTADSPELIAALRRRQLEAPARFTLLVPAVPHGLAWAADMSAGWSQAMQRAEAAVDRMRLGGVALERAIVGDPDPFAAVGDALHADEYDEVVVSTLPRGISRWLKMSLPDRIRRAGELPVVQVTAPRRRSLRPVERPQAARA
jgi:hypothetical protein